MLIVEFDGPPSWFLDVNETGEYKMPVGVGMKGWKNRETVRAFTLSLFHGIRCSSNGNA